MKEMLVICVLLCLINCRYNNKKLNGVILVIMTMIMSCNNKATDEMNLYYGYMELKNGIGVDITNFLYVNVLMGLANKLGMSFGVFNFATFLPAFLLLDKGLRKIINNPSLVYLLFCMTSIFLDTTLARQFISSVFIIYALHYLLGEEKNVKKYVIFIVIAMLFHFSTIVFLAYLLIELNISRRQMGIAVVGMSTAFLGVTLLNHKQIVGISQILSLIGSNKLNYGVSGGVQNGWMYTVVVWFLMFVTAFAIKNYSVNVMKDEDIVIVDRLMLMIGISLMFTSFSMMTLVYSRLLRPVSFIVFILITKWREYRKSFFKVNLIVLLLSITFLAGYYYVFNIAIFDYNATIRAVSDGIPFWDQDYSKLPWPSSYD